LIEKTLLYITTQTGELWPRRSPFSAKIEKDVKKFVTLLSYAVVMKFDMMQALMHSRS